MFIILVSFLYKMAISYFFSLRFFIYFSFFFSGAEEMRRDLVSNWVRVSIAL
jgi:hypothetical protein